MAALALGATAVGGLASAASTLAGGNYAAAAGEMGKKAANYKADQLESNATQAFASGQRTALDTREKTRLAISKSTARAAASGVDAGTGSPANNVGELAQRGEYSALMDMFNGASTASGLRNQAAGVRYEGELKELEGKAKQKSSYLSALGTIAGTAGSLAKSYGSGGF